MHLYLSILRVDGDFVICGASWESTVISGLLAVIGGVICIASWVMQFFSPQI